MNTRRVGNPISLAPSPVALGTTGKMIDALLDMLTPLQPGPRALTDIYGCILAESVSVLSDIPSHPVSTRDGYALNAAGLSDLSDRTDLVELPVFGCSSPGDTARLALMGNSVARILTGAPLPVGADTVVAQEDCEVVQSGGDIAQRIRTRLPVPVGQYLAEKGSEFPQGKIALEKGTFLDPLAATVLSMLGLRTALVYPRPRVGIIVTGSEVAKTGITPASNGPLLTNMVRAVGCEVASLAIVADDLADLERAFEHALDSDIILTTGGTGPGPKDIVGLAAQQYVERSLWNDRSEGSRARRFRILRGGRDSVRVPHLGLPGRPVAAVLSFCLFAYPLLRRLAGYPDVYPQACLARFGAATETKKLKRYQPVTLSRLGSNIVASPIPVAASEGMDAALRADGFALLSKRENETDRETELPILLLPWRSESSLWI